MPLPVPFTYYTGLERPLWFNPRLSGSWNGWTPIAMNTIVAPDGCPAFETTVNLEPGEHRWGVFVDSQARNNIWAVMDEAGLNTNERHRTFSIAPGETDHHEKYFFTHLRRLGAHKDAIGNMRFAVWAPHARAVEVVFADAGGYIYDDGRGLHAEQASIPLRRRSGGVWESDSLAPFATFVGRAYMFRVTRSDGSVRLRTDLYSRHQIGRGRIDPARTPYDGDIATLDGTKGASVVVDPDLVGGIPAAEFWRDELSHERQWQYDSPEHKNNLYYWFEGRGDDYPDFNAAVSADRRGMGGYLDNVSTGFAPRYSDETVRRLLIDSAVVMAEEFHIDGFRVDQTSSIRAYNGLHANGARVGAANAWGAKLLQQLSRTVKLVKPDAMLIAEDHEHGEAEEALTRPTDQNGIGFDAAWFSSFYHNLVGDAAGRSEARLIKFAGLGDDRPLAIDSFAGAMSWSGQKKVVYGESHDKAGNPEQTARTIVVAAGGAPLIGMTRRFAEARCRFAFAMAVLSAGTPMLLAGDEVGATKLMKHDDPLGSKEDLLGQRAADGAKLFACYSDLIKLRLRQPALRSRRIAIIRTDNEQRLIAFTRGDRELLVVGTPANQPRTQGISVDGEWQEIFNTDSVFYGGDNVGNAGNVLRPRDGVIVPANGVVVLRRT